MAVLLRATSLTGDTLATTPCIKTAVETALSLSAPLARAGRFGVTSSGVIRKTTASSGKVVFGRPT